MAGLEELQNIIIKMNQDIIALNARRSGLQNEIEKALKENKEVIDEEYAAHRNKIDAELADIENKKKLIAKLIEETSDWVAAEKDKIKKEYSELNNANIALSETHEVFLKEKIRADIEYNTRKDELNTQQNKLNEFERVLQQFESELKGRKYALDNKEFQLNELEEALNKKVESINVLQIAIEESLLNIAREKDGILTEKKGMLSLFKQLKDKETEVKSSDSVKAELVILEKNRIDIEQKFKANEELSKIVAAKQEVLREKEISLNEKEKLLVIETRKNDEKVKIIQKLREELKNG